MSEPDPASLPAVGPYFQALAERLEGLDRDEFALDQERRHLMRRNEERLQHYIGAAREWAAAWPQVASEIAGLTLLDAHEIVVRRAEGTLPFAANGPAP